MIRYHLVGRRAHLRISSRRWRELIHGLGERTDGHREAGAFLLADRHKATKTVSRVVFYDDLDPDCLVGGITFSFAGFPRLWELCDEQNVRVIGDVHTHSGQHVGQSHTDATNPMIAKRGHVALIVPDLATHPVTPHEVGVHRYLGGDGWSSHIGKDAATALYVGWWA